MIIFGTRVRHKVLGDGKFFCPRCQAQRSYLHKRASRYFTLYFIPIIPMGTLGEFIECQACGGTFEMSVLNQRGPAQPRPQAVNVAQMINTVPDRLKSGVPVEFLMRDLTAAGVDRDVAQSLINPHLAAGRKTCASCGLTYAAGVTTCASCKQPLSA
ncbi:MAG: zinc-ribbon domain-containing protein [Chloroflexi bacterium]|nr:MAG: zinc-ribbon domain-containing protein [Chloroflexota bacterium]